MEIKVIEPLTLQAVQTRYDVKSSEAIEIIKSNCEILKKLYEDGFCRLYWTAEDRETLDVLTQNRLVKDSKIITKMLQDLERCEKECKDDKPNDIEIIDNLGVFLEMCFQKCENWEFRQRLRKICRAYLPSQLELLLRLTATCYSMLLNSPQDAITKPSKKKKFIFHVCYEFLRDADKQCSKISREEKFSRLSTAQTTLADIIAKQHAEPEKESPKEKEEQPPVVQRKQKEISEPPVKKEKEKEKKKKVVITSKAEENVPARSFEKKKLREKSQMISKEEERSESEESEESESESEESEESESEESEESESEESES
jgi:hypothetical protein